MTVSLLRPVVRKSLLIYGLGSVALLMLVAESSIAADHYTFDSVHSIPEFQFSHLGATTQSGRFDKASGSATIDFANRRGSINYEIQTASLNMGFGTETPESAGYRLFDVNHFPKIRFKSNKLIFNLNNMVVAAEGNLTLLGVSKPIIVSVNDFKCSMSAVSKTNVCSCQVTATLNRSDFGMAKYIPIISDEIKIIVPIEAYKDN